AMGFGGGGPAPSPEQLKAMQEKLQSGGLPGGMPNLPKDLPAGLRQGLPNLPGLTGLPASRTCRASAVSRGRRNEPFLVIARSEATKQSMPPYAALWIASLRSQ